MSETPKNPIQRITDAVCAVLAEQGVSALSIRNVATRAGASIGLITHHFPNRAAMVKAAVNATWHKEQGVLVWPDTPDKAALLRAIKVFLPLDEVRRLQLSVWIAFLGIRTERPRAAEHSFGRLPHDPRCTYPLVVQAQPLDRRGYALC